MLTLNMVSLTVLTRLFLEQIIAARGKIMNVASMAGFVPGPYMASYFASKAYVLSFSEALAYELKGTGVTVTTLCPGVTQSGFFDQARMHDSGLVKNFKLPTADEVGRAGYRAMRRGRGVCRRAAQSAGHRRRPLCPPAIGDGHFGGCRRAEMRAGDQVNRRTEDSASPPLLFSPDHLPT